MTPMEDAAALALTKLLCNKSHIEISPVMGFRPTGMATHAQRACAEAATEAYFLSSDTPLGYNAIREIFETGYSSVAASGLRDFESRSYSHLRQQQARLQGLALHQGPDAGGSGG